MAPIGGEIEPSPWSKCLEVFLNDVFPNFSRNVKPIWLGSVSFGNPNIKMAGYQ